MTIIQRDALTIRGVVSRTLMNHVSPWLAPRERNENVKVVKDTRRNVTTINSMDVKCIIIRKRALGYQIIIGFTPLLQSRIPDNSSLAPEGDRHRAAEGCAPALCGDTASDGK